MAGPAKSGNGMRIDPALVRELAELLTENSLTEIEVEDGGRKIRVQRHPGAPMASAASAAQAPPAAPQPMTAPPMRYHPELAAEAERRFVALLHDVAVAPAV